MIQGLVKNWWLLALSGILDAIISVIYFNHVGQGFHALRDIASIGKLSVVAGACTIAAGIWRSAKGKSWLLVLNGLALVALGLIFNGIIGFRISLRTIALLMIVMTMSVGILELMSTRTVRRERHAVDTWLLRLAGVISVTFSLAFFALGFHWIKLGPGSVADLVWFGSYFGFSAICMLWVALRLRSQSDPSQTLPVFGNPRHAY